MNLYKGERNNEPVIQIPVALTAKVTPTPVEPISIQQKPEPVPTPVIQRESPQELKQLSIFDLFENAGEPVMVVTAPKRTTQAKRQSTNKKRGALGRQTDLFSGTIQQPYTPSKHNGSTHGTPQINGEKQEAIGYLFSDLSGNSRADKPAVPNIAISTIPEPAPYSSALQPFHRNDCLVADNGWVGHLQDVDAQDGTAVFNPLQLPSLQKARAEAYIALRDTYLDLY